MRKHSLPPHHHLKVQEHCKWCHRSTVFTFTLFIYCTHLQLCSIIVLPIQSPSVTGRKLTQREINLNKKELLALHNFYFPWMLLSIYEVQTISLFITWQIYASDKHNQSIFFKNKHRIAIGIKNCTFLNEFYHCI